MSIGLSDDLPRVAVIGGGLSGLTVATRLQFDAQVTVFESAKQVGGRLSSYQLNGFEFDAGAQYFTVQEEAFANVVEDWKSQQWVEPWEPWVVDIDTRGMMARESEHWWVAQPSMQSLLHNWAALCEDVQVNTAIVSMCREQEQWTLQDSRGNQHGPFHSCLFAVPPQALRSLLKPIAKEFVKPVKSVAYAPCWSVLAGVQSGLMLPYAAAFANHEVLSWVADNRCKPMRQGGEAWVLHATPEWSSSQSGLAPHEAAEQIWAAFESIVGYPLAQPQVMAAKFWAEAKVIQPLGENCLWSPQLELGACGDWCIAGHMEAAFLSGHALAEKWLESH